jgi:N-acetylglucosamine-6-phosphate deacetylase
MDSYLFTGMMLWPDGRLAPGDLLVERGKIAAMCDLDQIARQPDQQTIIPIPDGSLLAPGLIDMQLNGAFGHDFTRAPRQMAAVARHLPRFGVTAFLPTLVTAPLERYGTAVEAFKQMRREPGGAIVLGLNFEGPYLNSNRAGAHTTHYLRRPSLDELRYFDPEAVRVVVVAPELPDALPLIRALRERGIHIGLGHSVASYNQVVAAVAAGATFGVHIFNAMGALHHRHPGIVGALLAERDLSLSLIADGVHVHPSLLSIVAAAKQVSHVCLISDSVAATGMGPGDYYLGEQRVITDERSARLANGTLAGAVLTLDQAVRNMVFLAGRPPAEALQMASATPAKLLGLTGKGCLSPGGDADLILLDETLTVVLTMIDGQIVYKSG